LPSADATTGSNAAVAIEQTALKRRAIGSNSDGGENFEGFIDEVGLYDRALNADEVMQNYEAKLIFAVNPADKITTTWGNIKDTN